MSKICIIPLVVTCFLPPASLSPVKYQWRSHRPLECVLYHGNEKMDLKMNHAVVHRALPNKRPAPILLGFNSKERMCEGSKHHHDHDHDHHHNHGSVILAAFKSSLLVSTVVALFTAVTLIHFMTPVHSHPAFTLAVSSITNLTDPAHPPTSIWMKIKADPKATVSASGPTEKIFTLLLNEKKTLYKMVDVEERTLKKGLVCVLYEDLTNYKTLSIKGLTSKVPNEYLTSDFTKEHCKVHDHHHNKKNVGGKNAGGKKHSHSHNHNHNRSD